MADTTAKISVDDIVAAAGAGALRAMESRRSAAGGGGDEKITIDRLVSSGFGVHFQIWAGGWPGPWGPYGPGGGFPGGPGGLGGGTIGK